MERARNLGGRAPLRRVEANGGARPRRLRACTSVPRRIERLGRAPPTRAPSRAGAGAARVDPRSPRRGDTRRSRACSCGLEAVTTRRLRRELSAELTETEGGSEPGDGGACHPRQRPRRRLDDTARRRPAGGDEIERRGAGPRGSSSRKAISSALPSDVQLVVYSAPGGEVEAIRHARQPMCACPRYARARSGEAVEMSVGRRRPGFPFGPGVDRARAGGNAGGA